MNGIYGLYKLGVNLSSDEVKLWNKDTEIGYDIKEEYVKLANKRIDDCKHQGNLI